jgi:hypothetical protein
VRALRSDTRDSRGVPCLGCEQDEEEQFISFLRLPHVCANWYEAVHCREGEGRLSYFGYFELYGCVVAVCLKFPCAARDVLRSRGGDFITLVYGVLLNFGRSVLKMTETLWKNSLISVKDVWIICANFIVIAITFFERKNTGFTFVLPVVPPLFHKLQRNRNIRVQVAQISSCFTFCKLLT